METEISQLTAASVAKILPIASPPYSFFFPINHKIPPNHVDSYETEDPSGDYGCGY